MIECRDVVKDFDAGRVLDGVSLTIGRGELFVLLGSSGGGKSTLLRLINRLIPLTSGSITVDGADIASMPAEQLRRRIGYAIQSVGLFPHWTIEANIAAVPRLLGWDEARIAKRIDELMGLIRLDPAVKRRYPHHLSGGQQQRVGVARALAADPDLLLMDEPFGALDPITRAALQREVRSIQQATGKTIVLVTHDLDEALLLADRIAILDRGRIVQLGTPAEIVEQPANDFVRAFFGPDGAGLRRLAVRHVAERLSPETDAEGEPIASDATLAVAMSRMLAERADRLPVRDAAGQIVGAVRLADLVR